MIGGPIDGETFRTLVALVEEDCHFLQRSTDWDGQGDRDSINAGSMQ